MDYIWQNQKFCVPLHHAILNINNVWAYISIPEPRVSDKQQGVRYMLTKHYS